MVEVLIFMIAGGIVVVGIRHFIDRAVTEHEIAHCRLNNELRQRANRSGDDNIELVIAQERAQTADKAVYYRLWRWFN
jgi:hypothetical protein